MVTVDKIQRGVSRYLDEQLMPHLTGLKKWIIGGVATLYIANLNNIISGLASKPIYAYSGIFGENGTVNIEALINSIRPIAKTTSADIPIPFSAESVTVTEQDLDMILRYILQ